jgi:tetratricopeptide (TPR) repeat protein
MSVLHLAFLLSAHLLAAQSTAPNPLESANALRNRGEYQQATAILESFIQSQGPEADISAPAWLLLGSTYQDGGRYQEARRAYERVISLTRDRPGYEREAAVALDNLGSLYLDLGQPEISKRLRLRVLKIAQNTGDHAFVARIYNNLTAIASRRKEISEARKWSAHALAEIKLAPQADADDLAAISSNAGWLCVYDHDYKQASAFYEVALQSWIEKHGMNHQLTGLGYVLRGRIRALQGDTAAGLKDLETGIAIIEKTVGTRVPIYFSARLDYSDALSKAGSVKQANAIRSETVRTIQSFVRSTQSTTAISADAFR